MINKKFHIFLLIIFMIIFSKYHKNNNQQVGESYKKTNPQVPQVKTGTIRGRLIWVGGQIPASDENTQRDKYVICKSKQQIINKEIQIDKLTNGISYGVAYLVKPNGDFSQEEEKLLKRTPEVIIDQKDCEFLPYISLVHKKQILKFKIENFTDHRVSFSSPNHPNELIASRDSKSRLDRFAKIIKEQVQIPAKINCTIHPWMESYFLNIDHPFATVTKVDGSFEIANIPAGEQHLIVWQPTRGYINEGGKKGMTVAVPAGGIIDVGSIEILK